MLTDEQMKAMLFYLYSDGWTESDYKLARAIEAAVLKDAPAWHDMPTCEGLWVEVTTHGEWSIRNCPPRFELDGGYDARYFGPIPADQGE